MRKRFVPMGIMLCFGLVLSGCEGGAITPQMASAAQACAQQGEQGRQGEAQRQSCTRQQIQFPIITM